MGLQEKFSELISCSLLHWHSGSQPEGTKSLAYDPMSPGSDRDQLDAKLVQGKFERVAEPARKDGADDVV